MKNLQLRENVALAPLTTLRIGGAARFFVSAAAESDIIEAVRFADENNLNLFVLGGGSNVLIADAGFDGLVLQIATKGIEILPEDAETVCVTAQAGEDWDDFCAFCVERNFAGVECLSGIPGLVGGTPVQNVGAYGQEVADTIVKVRAFDRKTKEFVELSNAACEFTYRTSLFNSAEKNRYIVSSVSFRLKIGGAPQIIYKDLREFFKNSQPNLTQTRNAVWQIRRAKSMVIDAADANSKSAGSFFKNPIISKEKLAQIRQKTGDEIPYFPVDNSTVKVPAAWLVEKSGFTRNFHFGNVGISANHTLAIINRGSATAAEVLNFKSEIQRRVKEKFDIELKPEPVLIGF